MANSVSIAVMLRDEMSPTIHSLRNANRQFGESFDELSMKMSSFEKRQDAITKHTAGVQTQMVAAKAEVREAAKAFSELGNEANRLRLDAANENVARLKLELRECNAASRDTERAMRDLSEEQRRLINSASGGGGGLAAGGGADSSLMTALGQAGIYKMAGDVAARATNTLVTSIAGDEIGGLFSSALSGSAAGAALGTIVPGIGTAVGAAVGGAIGLAGGAVSMYEGRDTAFKSYVQEQYNTVTAAQDETLAGGIGIAGTREQNRLAFVKRFGGESMADEFLEGVRALALETTYTFDEITGYAKVMLNAFSADEVMKNLVTLSDASAGLNLNSADVDMLISGLSRMRTTDKAYQRYLNYFLERGIDAYAALSEHLGVSVEDLPDMITDGDISGKVAADALLDYMEQTFGGLAESMAKTYLGMVGNLEDAQAELDKHMGEGFNEERKRGLQAQMDWLEGDSGIALQRAYEAIGAFEAHLENEKERFEREAIDRMMSTDEYRAAEAAGEAATMGRLIMQAKVQAANEYNASDGALLMRQSELDLIHGIQGDAVLQDEYWNAGYRMGLKFSEGLASAVRPRDWADPSTTMEGYDPAHGLGVDYSMPNLLPSPSQVSTPASFGDDFGFGGTQINVTVTGNEFSAKSDADAERVARYIVSEVVRQKQLLV